ncbi:MAG: DUF998 domain-containing protein [Pseudonocardiaceae bacterium]|nr:DUF998 domain-containing protein [Pseudonocardiaceae bacterium]
MSGQPASVAGANAQVAGGKVVAGGDGVRRLAWLTGVSTAALGLAAFAVISLGRSLITMTYLNVKFFDQVDPFSRAVSYYVFVDQARRLFTATLFTVVLATIAVLAGIRWIGIRLGGPTVVFFGVWCVSLTLCAIFPTDDAPTIQSASGMIHQIAGASLFVSLPLAGSALAYRLRAYPGWERVARIVRRTSLIAAGLALSYLIARLPDLYPSLVFVDFFDARGISGLIQRVLFGLEIVVLMILAVRLLEACAVKMRDRRRRTRAIAGSTP